MASLAYRCRGCLGPPSPRRWTGPCPTCGGYWSITQVRVSDGDVPGALRAPIEDGEAVSLCDVLDGDDEVDVERIVLGGEMSGVDHVLGGGLVPGSVTLLSGPPGVGKSTLTLQLLQRVASTKRALYLVGEESVRAVARRAKRLGKFHPRLIVKRETALDEIVDSIADERPHVVVVDSVQTVACESPSTYEPLEVGSAMSISVAVRELARVAQEEGIALILVGHVTKDGDLAGPRSGLEHAVDCVLSFDGDPSSAERVLCCPRKNRHGVAGPSAVARYEMTSRGLVPVEKSERAA